MHDPSSRRTRWRWPHIRISVRGLMVLVLILGGGLGWLVHRAQVQRHAVAAIGRAGGRVTYDWEWANGRRVPNAQPRWPRWLVDRLGVDYFGNVVVADFRGTQVGDADLAHLEGLTGLRVLSLRDTRVGDAGLAHLKGLTGLQNLDLFRTGVGYAGVEELQQALPKVEITR
jgi:hypothetical protein